MNFRRSLVSGCVVGALSALLGGMPTGAQAQVWAIEGVPWQFNTPADKANKAITLDLMERKKGGYYDAFQTNNYITNNTHIERQYNCSQTALSTGNSSSSSQSSVTSSPNVSNSGSNQSGATGNSNAAGGTRGGTTSQGNSGTVDSGVTGSSASASSGPVNAGHGQSSQALNTDQSNTGRQVAYLDSSVACSGALN